MTTKMLTVRITAEQQQRWTAAANAAGVMLSDWVRRTCDWEHDKQIGKPEVAGTRESGRELAGTDAVQQHAREMAKDYEVVPPAVEVQKPKWPKRGGKREKKQSDSGGLKCKHGTPKGDHCWRCAGIAQV